MHWKRWLSGLVMAPSLILFILYAPPWLFFGFILLLIYLGLQEFYHLTAPEISPGPKAAAVLLAFLLAFSLICPDPRGFLAGLAFAVLFWFIGALWKREEFPLRVQHVSLHLLGLLYIAFLLSHFILLRKLDHGKMWILFTLVSVYFGDTTAFYVGRAWGKRKMAPTISPNKTMEGGRGAVVGSLGGAVLFQGFFFPELGMVAASVLGAMIGGIGQLGDLFESLLKRSAHLKDSGTLIPGHGGLLDRIDSVLFAAPLVYYYAWLIASK